jgi:hypothetical protein
MHRLNVIAPGSIGDRAHIAILLIQIGPEYVLVVDAIQNDKNPVNPTTIGNRLANAEQTVHRKSATTIPHEMPITLYHWPRETLEPGRSELGTKMGLWETKRVYG